MKQKYLFRGLDKSKRWVYGSLIQVGDYCCILENDCEKYGVTYLNSELGFIDGEAVPVDPNSVGLFLHKLDKNRRKIFEGDRIRRTTDGRNPIEFIALGSDQFPKTCDVYYGPFEHFEETCEYEIIGNIHEEKKEEK